jgi:hypothetical protein
MITMHTGARVLVGPHDLVTTSVVAALQTRGFRAQEWAAGCATRRARHRRPRRQSPSPFVARAGLNRAGSGTLGPCTAI